jgi:nicotinamidase-related amidase
VLVVCDCQLDALGAIDAATRETVLDAVRLAVTAARAARWRIVFTGLQFPARYDGLSPSNRLYGALARVNALAGDAAAHWFLQGWPGTAVDSSLLSGNNNNDDVDNNKNDKIFWRSSPLTGTAEFTDWMRTHGVQEATVVGIKAAQAVQSTVQALCDMDIDVSVVTECVADDTPERCAAVLEHVVSVYANVVPLPVWIDHAIGFLEFETVLQQQRVTEGAAAASPINNNITKKKIQEKKVQYLADCGRGGHFPLYAAHLLRQTLASTNTNTCWRRYPIQPWYTDNLANRSYQCPLGKPVLDFCDEPRFSSVSMFLKGREWLDEKEKLVQLLTSNNADQAIMPETFIFQNGVWVNDKVPVDATTAGAAGPWFVKECDKNGGRAIRLCRTASECTEMLLSDAAGTTTNNNNKSNSKSTFVVQAHIANPLLTVNGNKCHVKFYSLLQCAADGVSWQLHTYPESFLCVAVNQWSADDIDPETQVTIRRNVRLYSNEEMPSWTGWPIAYKQCQGHVATVVERACREGKLTGRPGKKQFEIFCTDFILDTAGKAWLIECNLGPVLFDPTAKQELTTVGLKEYQRLYDLHGDAVVINDRAMIADAVSMVFFPEEDQQEAQASSSTRWDPAGHFTGQLPSTESNATSMLPGLFATMM